MELRFTGHTFDPEQVRTGDEQKSFVNGAVGRVAEGLTVESFSVSTLSDEALDGTAKVKFAKPLPSVGERRRLTLGPEFPFLATTPVPLAAIERRLPVELAGPVVELLDLKIELPEGQLPAASPSNLERSVGDWATTELTVSGTDSAQLVIRRVVRITRAEIAAAEFIPLRDAINELRADSSRTIVFGK